MRKIRMGILYAIAALGAYCLFRLGGVVAGGDAAQTLLPTNAFLFLMGLGGVLALLSPPIYRTRW
ncbi:hypothetical protein IIA79_00645 [bacterium]|nr:hypothetical protein [bacterium]